MKILWLEEDDYMSVSFGKRAPHFEYYSFYTLWHSGKFNLERLEKYE